MDVGLHAREGGSGRLLQLLRVPHMQRAVRKGGLPLTGERSEAPIPSFVPSPFLLSAFHFLEDLYTLRGDATVRRGRNSAVWWAHARTREDNRGVIFSPHRFPRELEGFPDRGAAERVASPSRICDEVITAAAAEQRRREPQHGQGDQAVLQGGDADPPDKEKFPAGRAQFDPSWIVLNIPLYCSLLVVSRKKRLPHARLHVFSLPCLPASPFSLLFLLRLLSSPISFSSSLFP